MAMQLIQAFGQPFVIWMILGFTILIGGFIVQIIYFDGSSSRSNAGTTPEPQPTDKHTGLDF